MPLEDAVLKEWPAFLRCLTPQSSISLGSHQFSESAQVCCPEDQGLYSTNTLPYSFQDLQLQYFMVATVKAAIDSHTPTRTSLLLNSRASFAAPLVGPSSAFIMRMSLTPSRNKLACFCSYVLSSSFLIHPPTYPDCVDGL